VAVAQRSLAEIHRLNLTLKAFITVNPNLMSDAVKLDALRRAGTVLPLHCVTVAVKDNIDVAGMPTTGGSVLLAHNCPTHDAEVVRRLRAAGALFVGKTKIVLTHSFDAVDHPQYPDLWSIIDAIIPIHITSIIERTAHLAGHLCRRMWQQWCQYHEVCKY
jgi:Amidase